MQCYAGGKKIPTSPCDETDLGGSGGVGEDDLLWQQDVLVPRRFVLRCDQLDAVGG